MKGSRFTLAFLTATAATASLSFAPSAMRAPSCAFLSDNFLSIPADSASSVTRADFEDALARIRQAYEPVFQSDGRTLVIEADWTDSRVNAYATRDDLNNPVLVAPGGIARHKLMTRDGLLAVFCHEIGHFLGGAPKARRGQSELLSWSSAEGAADYFASAKCLKKVFDDESENRSVVESLPESRRRELRAHCGPSYECMRVLEAGRAATHVFAAVKGQSSFPQLTARDPSRPSQTIDGHPAPQCRLDTFVSGAQCAISPDAPMDDRDPTVGACVPPRERVGGRPRCWFVAS